MPAGYEEVEAMGGILEIIQPMGEANDDEGDFEIMNVTEDISAVADFECQPCDARTPKTLWDPLFAHTSRGRRAQRNPQAL